MTYTEWQQGDHVRELQEYLRALALTDNNHRELAVDGIYGPKTTEAVSQFQAANGLAVTGKADSDTWERLVADYLDALTLLSEAVPVKVFPQPQYVIRYGDKGNLIYILQAVLNTLSDAAEAILVSGEYDRATEQRVKDLQQLGGFPETGEVDRAFWDHLAMRYNYA
ncbi:MAG: peptidoglycan-binding protein [Clostridia bacterium]|nr:peptidoglycan-binding protein [Clostridia bacterium]